MRKGGKKKPKCGFPKEKQLNTISRVICRGNARRYEVRITGKRNSFGIIQGRRTRPWLSGTTPSFAAVFRSNTHTQPNYRLPLLPGTHDDSQCKSKRRENVRDLNVM